MSFSLETNINLITICIVFVLALVSCASTKAPVKETNEAGAAQNVNILGKYGVPKPDWTTHEVTASDRFYAAGSAKFSNQSLAIKAARTQAKANLAEYIASLIKEITEYYMNQAGINGDDEAMAGAENAMKDKAEAMLTGIMQEDMWEAEDGTIWVLMSMPLENVEQNITRALEEITKASNTYEENECATKAREYMEKGIAELESN